MVLIAGTPCSKRLLPGEEMFSGLAWLDRSGVFASLTGPKVRWAGDKTFVGRVVDFAWRKGDFAWRKGVTDRDMTQMKLRARPRPHPDITKK